MAQDTYEVTLLREGIERTEENGCVKRQCNMVLIRGPCGTMVVNPGSAWDGPVLTESLKKNGISGPSEIKYVVCTDGRANHVGCLSLFTNAEMIIVGHDIQKPGDLFVEHDFADDHVPFEFDENVSQGFDILNICIEYISMSLSPSCQLWAPRAQWISR